MKALLQYQDLPIQRKLSIIVVIGIVSAIIVTVANFISFDRDNVKRDLVEEMRVLARITAVRSAVAVAFGDKTNAVENVSALELRSTVQHACIYNQQQQLFAQYQRQYSLFEGCPSVLDYEYPDGNLANRDAQLLEVVEPIIRKGKPLGFVLVGSDLSPITARTRKWVSISFYVTLAALFVAYLITRRLLRAVVEPIVGLSTVMDEVRNSNNLSLRAQAKGRDEVGMLVHSFNDMLKIVENHNHDLEVLYRGLVEKSAEAEATAASLELRNAHVKDQFGSAAHDLRQPLQAMAIFVDALCHKVDDPDQLSILDKLKQAMLNLNHLFTEILDVSRYEFDAAKASNQPTSIKNLLSKVYLEFEAIAAQKNLKLRFYTPDYKVLTHGALLERIIRNLLSNAIRYTDKGGVLLGCRRRGETLIIEVWDTGRGIPEKNKASIFTKYVQIDEEDRTERGGFGLGLAIVKQFVDSLGYDLSVQSVVGRGTVFRLTVPLAANAVANKNLAREISDQRVERRQSSLKKATFDSMQEQAASHILLIDDNSDVRDALKMTLEGWGFNVDDFPDMESLAQFYREGGAVPFL
jgi:signal transduction histidine kinase